MPSTTPCFSMNSVQLLRTWGTVNRNSVASHITSLSVNNCPVISEGYRVKERVALLFEVCIQCVQARVQGPFGHAAAGSEGILCENNFLYFRKGKHFSSLGWKNFNFVKWKGIYPEELEKYCVFIGAFHWLLTFFLH